MTTYKEENDILLKSFLEHTFFNKFRKEERSYLWEDNWKKIEIYVDDTCDLSCKYCYLTKYGNELYPQSKKKHTNLYKNLDMLLQWIYDNKFTVNLELFSGELLSRQFGRNIVRRILEFYRDRDYKPKVIIIPSNMTFIFNEQYIKEVTNLLEISKEIGIKLCISASVDGKYCESNRPFKNKNLIRDDKYYDKLFSFCKKWDIGFHPMIYSKKIDKWIDNFNWFMDMFRKYDMDSGFLYLLEVRNSEWSEKDIKNFGKFIRYLVRWSYDFNNKDIKQYISWLREKKGFNILSNPLMTIGRGLGCSFQSTLFIRLGDLAIVPCHRTAYNGFIAGYLNNDGKQIIDITSKNIATYISAVTTNSNQYPFCEQCVISSMCPHGCLGSQYEEMGDLFTPIPTVCQLEHVKIKSLIDEYKKLGIYGYIYEYVNSDKKRTMEIIGEI